MGMKRPVYHYHRAIINLALSWHSSVEEIADHNFNIITGKLNFNIVTTKLNKRMKSLNPAAPWGPKDFFSAVGYHTHNLEGYVPKPESLVIPSKPPTTERPAEDQPFLAHLSQNYGSKTKFSHF